tara:strand:- start:337 stop:576 length:240 start_codon:yes stop_codon:yes gene_type:complete
MTESNLKNSEFSLIANEVDLPVFYKIRDLLKTISDGGIDTGIGMGKSDYWVTVNGVEYWITASRNAYQTLKDNAGEVRQ